MALFNRDYDRDYGYRTGGYRTESNRDRDWGDRMRRGWNELKHDTRDFFGGYDRDMGNRQRDRWNTLRAEGDERSIRGYDRDRFLGQRQRWNTPGSYAGAGYDRDYGNPDRGFRGTSPTYDRDYGQGWGFKNRAETDYGDPFGDRTQRTPMRITRGRFQGRYDRDLQQGSRWGARYGRDYDTNPAGYEPNRWRGYNRNY